METYESGLVTVGLGFVIAAVVAVLVLMDGLAFDAGDAFGLSLGFAFIVLGMYAYKLGQNQADLESRLADLEE